MSGTIKSLLFFTFLTSFSRDMYGVIFNLFLRESGIGNTFIGTVTSLSLWGSAVLGLLISVYADAKGRKVALIISTAGYIFTGFYMIFIKDETQLLLFSFLRGGFGVSNFTVIVAMIVDATTPKNRAKVFGANFGISMGSGVFGNFVGGFFGDQFGFQWTLVISMVIFSLSLFILFPLKVERKVSPIRKVFDFSSFSKKQKQIVAFNYLSTISVGFGAGLFIHFGNLIFKDLFDLSPTMIGIALSVAQLGTAGGSMVTHRLGRRFGPMEFCLVMR